jgi:hypothetical protein
LGFDGKALLEAFVGIVVGLIALFSSYDHVNLPSRQFSLQQWGVWLIAFSLPLVLRMLNWRRDPAAEQRRMQLEKELALLEWIESEIDLIEADLPSISTPPPTIAANFSDC